MNNPPDAVNASAPGVFNFGKQGALFSLGNNVWLFVTSNPDDASGGAKRLTELLPGSPRVIGVASSEKATYTPLEGNADLLGLIRKIVKEELAHAK